MATVLFFAMSSPAAPDFPIEDAQGLVWAFCIYSGGLLFLRPLWYDNASGVFIQDLFTMESCSLVGGAQEMANIESLG
jgi:hypothetical protein